MQTSKVQTSKIQTCKMRRGIDTIYQEIGIQIKLARKRKGLTQDELSERIHLSRSSVANIEHGRHKFQTHVLYEISSALDCNVTDLLPSDRTNQSAHSV